MRCFFHLVGAHGSILDVEGVDVPHMDELRAVVADTVEEVRQDHPSGAIDWKGWRLEVTDTSGAVLLTINLDHPV